MIMVETTDCLQTKRRRVLEAIDPICSVFGIKDYDYIVSKNGQREILRIYDVKIACSGNSIDAVVDELIGYIFVKRYCKNRYIGAFKTQTLNRIKAYWIKGA